MRADMAAAYMDERTTRSFLAKIGIWYPRPLVFGRGNRWRIVDLQLVGEDQISVAPPDLDDKM